MKKIMLGLVFTLFFTLIYSKVVQAQLDPASKEALKETKQMLKDPKAIEEYSKKNEDAKKADDYAGSVVGGDPEKKKNLYRITSSVMESITHKSQGDPQKMQKLMEEAQNDPEKFYNSLTPEQRKAIQDLGKQLAPAAGKSP